MSKEQELLDAVKGLSDSRNRVKSLLKEWNMTELCNINSRLENGEKTVLERAIKEYCESNRVDY